MPPGRPHPHYRPLNNFRARDHRSDPGPGIVFVVARFSLRSAGRDGSAGPQRDGRVVGGRPSRDGLAEPRRDGRVVEGRDCDGTAGPKRDDPPPGRVEAKGAPVQLEPAPPVHFDNFLNSIEKEISGHIDILFEYYDECKLLLCLDAVRRAR